ncbi:Vmc-like lipoprotein signal peptide domain-containing protein [Ureaplasma diversum]|uniref:Uncharacterized protein n=1 Tax=Ureaplasma diversum NCTC 246 TaxID=1188241 RepID=A0A084EXY2_9BACT|nr:hypothetical protein [Ureaplasma diversum]KEZ22824.1 Hypothetical protein, predicted lipoprotein [Ureaplasma diversum NCTC 246]
MKHKSKHKWLISSLVVLSATSIVAVAASCTPKSGDSTKQTTPTKPKSNNPVNKSTDQTKNNPTNPNKNTNNKDKSPLNQTNPSNSKKEQDKRDNDLKNKDQKEPLKQQNPNNEMNQKDQADSKDSMKDGMADSSKQDKDSKDQKQDVNPQAKMDTDKNKEKEKDQQKDEMAKPDNGGGSSSGSGTKPGSSSSPKVNQPEKQNMDSQPSPQQPPAASPKPDQMLGDEPRDDDQSGSKTGKDKEKEAKPDQGSGSQKGEVEKQMDEGKMQPQNTPPTNSQTRPQPQGQGQGETQSQPGTKPQTQSPSQPQVMPKEEEIDKSKPLLELNGDNPFISLNPGSNEGKLSIKLSKQDYNGSLENKSIFVKLKRIDGEGEALSIPKKISENSNTINIELDFRPIIDSGKYKLDFASIYDQQMNNRPQPENIVNVVFKQNDKNKTISVSKAMSNRTVPDTEMNKMPVDIKLENTGDKLTLSVKTKDGMPLKDKYLRYGIFGLQKSSKVYTTASETSNELSMVKDGQLVISDLENVKSYRNIYDQIVIKVYGIYDDEQGVKKSMDYRFNYEDNTSRIDLNNNLILFKEIQ